jgi:hypothetical protein
MLVNKTNGKELSLDLFSKKLFHEVLNGWASISLFFQKLNNKYQEFYSSNDITSFPI